LSLNCPIVCENKNLGNLRILKCRQIKEEERFGFENKALKMAREGFFVAFAYLA
jgi:hypothetical protein